MSNLKRPIIPTVIKRFGNSHVIWFENSASFVVFEEPAFDVFRLITEGEKTNVIIAYCEKKYGKVEKEISRFVYEIGGIIELFNQKNQRKNRSQKNGLDVNIELPDIQIQKNYQLGSEPITIRFGNETLEWAIHPLFAHLEKDINHTEKHRLELFEHNNTLIFTYNSQITEAFKSKDIEYLTAAVMQQLYSILFRKEYKSWMMALHASGIVKNNQSVLFSATGGSGKSTIAALLKAHGFGYLSDDFVLANKNGEVYPLPTAISVKEGSVTRLSEFYAEITNKKYRETLSGKSVKYIPVHNSDEIRAAPYPVKALVFVQYQDSGNFYFNEVDKKEALEKLLKETWVNPSKEHVSAFFEWVEKIQFYRLRYSKTTDALAAIHQLFEK